MKHLCKECIHYGLCEYHTLIDREIECKDFFPEIVHCKDCKHWNAIEMECKNDCVATDNEGGASFSLNFYLDDFCSYGERREEK